MALCCFLAQSAAGIIQIDGRGFLTALSDAIRNDTHVPTMVGGLLVTSDEVITVLAAGRADLCIMDPPDADRTDDPDREREPND